MGVWVAGPSAGGIMADWGADVIKVEPPSGDPFRNLFGSIGHHRQDLPNPPFALDNRGKRSVVLDLSTAGPAGEHAREALDRLLASADVFLTNMRPAALERLGLDPKTVTGAHPRLVYASVSGYGLDGPDRDRAGYDVGAFWARTGIASQLVPLEQAPPGIRGGFGDHVTGISIVSGILGALLERERTGEGSVVETSLLRCGMYTLGWDLGIQLTFDKVAPASPRADSPTPLVNSYRAADDRWFFLIGLEADRHFPGLAKAVDREDWLADERFNSAGGRVANRREFIAALDEVFAARPLHEWAERFDLYDVWWSPVQPPAESVVDPQALATGAVVDVEGGGAEATALRAINSPVEFHRHRRRSYGHVPALGEHTDEVLASLGMAGHVAGQPPPGAQ